MGDDRLPAFERFLIEDVILTLGNLRSTLGWLTDAESGLGTESLRAGLDRIGRQIEMLQDRARAVCGPPEVPEAPSGAGGMTLASLLQDALGAEGEPPMFRSRRRANG